MSLLSLHRLPGMSALSGFLIANGVNPASTLKLNLAATTDPTGSSDSSQGYGVGSMWVNTTSNPKAFFVCLDATPTAAVWQKMMPSAISGKYRVKSDGTFQLFNTETSLYYGVSVKGAVGSEYLNLTLPGEL